MTIEIPRKKWIHVYNSISLFWFIIESNQQKQEQIAEINQSYNKFCQEHHLPGQNFNITAPENLILFGYAIIVRTHEIIDPAIKGININGRSAKEFIVQSIFDAAISYDATTWFKSYDNIIISQNINIKTCTYNNKSEHEKFYDFIKHLRHSIAHSTYEIEDGINNICFKSESKDKVNLEVSMSINAYINFILTFIISLNRVLHEKNLLV